MIINEYNPKVVYGSLIKIIGEINKNIDELTKIKNLILIFHNSIYLKQINNITNIIKDINEKTLKSYKNQTTRTEIDEINKHKALCSQVEEVKDFMLFKVIYDEALGINQEKRFNDAMTKLEEIKRSFDENEKIDTIYEKNKRVFDKIKDILSNNEKKADKFIDQIKIYYKDSLKDKGELINDLTMIFKSKKYEKRFKKYNFLF